MSEPVPLPRETPESRNVDPAVIAAFIREADAQSARLHSLMILRGGDVVAESWWNPYRADLRHTMFSVSKSFASTAVGFAVDEGLLSVDEPILSIFPTYASAAHRRNVGTMTLHNVLTMSTGHEVDTMETMRAQPESDWIDVFLGTPVVYPPGQHFLYNSGASFVLAAAVTARTGQHLLDYLTPRLFEPLGMSVPPWAESPRGIALGASGLRLYTEDLAKLGQLYLQHGRWGGEQLLSDAWVKAATSHQVDNHNDAPDWNAGYGYQFWQSTHSSFRADGAYGQFAFVLPEQDAVVAITAGLKENWRIPPLVWEHLLPAFDNASTATSQQLSQDTIALEAAISELIVPTPPFLDHAPACEAKLSGRKFSLSFNTLGVVAGTLTIDGGATVLELESADGKTETLQADHDRWTAGITRLWPYDEGFDETETSSRAGWTNDRQFEIHQQCIETAFRRIWTFTLDENDNLQVDIKLDLGFWADRVETLRAAFA